MSNPSSLTSRPTRSGRRRDRLHDRHGAIGRCEGTVRHAAYVLLRDFLQAIDVVEQLPPVAISRLINSELRRQSAILAQAANQVGLGPRLHHLQFGVTYVLRLDAIDLFLEPSLQLGRSV